ncbi:site-specific integrase [Cyanobacterium aponinum FACHB-4101]|uniref:tyrosine-type recombinase/integrase n=1 Tax=Cyanobacterium aponinum TaxID=379064 RepID=UPI00167FFDC4|nr:site-specific integrase [Cyanobacterium aponinum]MBD2395679.1 site-specific integrase [Cyanobacterium aponinum FACHB-4101]
MIKVESHQNKLRLVIPTKFYPQRYYYLGLPDDEFYLPIAHQLKQLIESDIFSGKFDGNFEKYNAQSVDNIYFVWEQYCLFKKRHLKRASFKNLTTVTNHLKRIPPEVIVNGSALKLWLSSNLSLEQARRVLIQIKACAKWGVEMGYLSRNPYKLIRGLPRIRKREIDPFSKHERDRIIQAFANHDHYSYYCSFVRFLFLTGCRPSEAVALRWEKVDGSFILFNESYVEGVRQDSTKTYSSRRFPINQQLRGLLNEIPRKNELVFRAKQGGVINLNNFCRRAWHTVIDELGIRYRKPYNCRHTFITECLTANIPVATVAYWVGNSPEIIYRHYAGVCPMEVPMI